MGGRRRRTPISIVYLQSTGLKDYSAIEGNRGVAASLRIDGDIAEFLIVTRWDSMDAIEKFPGSNPETAVYDPEDDAFLLEREPHVIHYEVAYPQ